MMRITLLFFLALIIPSLAFSQHSHRAYLTLADSLYKHHNYLQASAYYQRALKDADHPGDIMLKIARSYGKTNDLKAAEPWYEKAKKNHAAFSNEDSFHYAKALITLNRRSEGEEILLGLLKRDSNASYARQLLNDLQDKSRYYADSLAYHVTPLSINTDEAEFAPAYYKDGIVFASSQPEFILKKKYHWDNSAFLKLYYSAKIVNNTFQKPTNFDKDINTRFHDGPVVFYAKDEKMILNRNQQIKTNEKTNIKISHLSLFDVSRDAAKKEWVFSALPFDEPPYSFAHPSISEDGNTLYFISNRPGGYGGTDIYRSDRTNGQWSEPFNVGPSINTSENEVFPFYINNTLYFASDGHGGLGGLDIFKSEKNVNGFTPAINLDYPINSPYDDFSLITKDQQTGYFSSARKGNDDIFEFVKAPDAVKLIARIYDGVTRESLSDASVQLMTMSTHDTTLTSGIGGNLQFELPRETDYILIANKDGKVGMYSSQAILEEDYQHVVHQVAVYGDTSRIVCVGRIENENGILQNASSITIMDETTGKETSRSKDQSLVSFLGEKGHTYRIKIQNELGDTVSHKLEIRPEDSGSKTWSIVLKEAPAVMTLSARVFNAETNAPLGGAQVKIITFTDTDQELTADENGIVEFSLPMDAAYLVVGSKDGLTGKHAGIVEKGMDKSSIVHPVAAVGDPGNPVPVLALVSNAKGEVLDGAKATITDKATGESVPGEIENGVLNFFAEHGKAYNIAVEHEGHQTTLEEIVITEDATAVEKISVVMEETKPARYTLAARVIKETDHTVMPGARVQIMNLEDSDMELIADSDGLVEFSLPEGMAYIVAADKDGFTGMYMGVAETGMDKQTIIHDVLVNNDPASTLQIFGMVKDENGVPITNAVVEVIDMKTGEKVLSKVEDGIISFNGKRGEQYKVTVSAEGYGTQEKTIPINSTASVVDPLTINLTKKLAVTIQVVGKNEEVLRDASVTVTDKTTGEKSQTQIKDGALSFVGEQGKEYTIAVEHKDYKSVAEELTIPQKAEVVAPLSIALVGTATIPQPGTTENIQTASNNNTDKTLPMVSPNAGEPGNSMMTKAAVTNSLVEKEVLPLNEKHRDTNEAATTTEGQGQLAKTTTVGAATSKAQPVEAMSAAEKKTISYVMAVRAFKEVDNSNLAGASMTIMSFTAPDIEQVANAEGITRFTLPEGTPFIIVASKDGYTGMYSGIADKEMDEAHIIHPIPTHNDPNKQIPVVSFITDETGKPTTIAQAILTNNATGEKNKLKIENGILSFDGKKGGAYEVVIIAEGYEEKVRTINIDPTASSVQQLEIKLETIKIISYVMAAQAFKESDHSPLANAEVKIMSFTDSDIEQIANAEGITEFTLPEGTPYIIIANKDGYTGMYSGIAEKGMDKNSIIHPIPTQNDPDKQLPVISLVADESGKPMINAQAMVTDNTTGEAVASKIESGILSFAGKKGGDYKIEILDSDHEKQVEHIKIAPYAAKVEPLEILLARKKLLTLPDSSNLIILNNETPKFYIVSDKIYDEIIEKDGMLYLQTKEETKPIGKGSLAGLMEDPSKIIQLSEDQTITLQNIYFDKNSFELDKTDQQELDKATAIIARYPFMQLSVKAHADLRGTHQHNLSLTQQRARSIKTYLVNHGVNQRNIKTKALGKSAPSVMCDTQECTEQQHQKNRRAEFVIAPMQSADKDPLAVVKPLAAELKPNARTRVSPRYAKILALYGDQKSENIVFKVCVGAYRQNPDLTFPELSDLGQIEKKLKDGIVYYYLCDFPSLNTAEEICQQVIQRGIPDAYITIFYKNDKIPLETFTSILRNGK